MLSQLASVKVDKDDRPLTDIVIAHCGELERRKKPTDGATESEKTESRGRKRRRTSADQRSPSTGVPVRSPSPHQRRPKARRRDSSLDPTLRGRPRQRSASRYTPPAEAGEDGKRRKKDARHRSQSPSRSRTPSRSSPRRRRYRSRSHPRPHRASRAPGHNGQQYSRARRDDDYDEALDADEERFLRQQELEREGGAERFEGIIADDEEDEGERNAYSRDARDERSGAGYRHRDDERRGWDGTARHRGGGEGRLDGRLGGGGGDDESADGQVKFKGRGRMNYRERRTRW